MNKLFIYLILSIFPSLVISHSNEAKVRILNVVKKLEAVPHYSCDVNIDINVKFIKIKERTGKMYYKSPNEIDYKINGFAFLPKKEMGATSTDLFQNKSKLWEIELISEKNFNLINKILLKNFS